MHTETRDWRDEMNERFTNPTQRVDENTLILNLLAGAVYAHETRVDQLEHS